MSRSCTKYALLVVYLVVIIQSSKQEGFTSAFRCSSICRRAEESLCKRCLFREPMRFGKRMSAPPSPPAAMPVQAINGLYEYDNINSVDKRKNLREPMRFGKKSSRMSELREPMRFGKKSNSFPDADTPFVVVDVSSRFNWKEVPESGNLIAPPDNDKSVASGDDGWNEGHQDALTSA